MVNFPADVRKNLRGIVLPEDKEEGTRGEAKGGGVLKNGQEGKTSQGTLDYHCTQRELTNLYPKHTNPKSLFVTHASHTVILHTDDKANIPS